MDTTDMCFMTNDNAPKVFSETTLDVMIYPWMN